LGLRQPKRVSQWFLSLQNHFSISWKSFSYLLQNFLWHDQNDYFPTYNHFFWPFLWNDFPIRSSARGPYPNYFYIFLLSHLQPKLSICSSRYCLSCIYYWVASHFINYKIWLYKNTFSLACSGCSELLEGNKCYYIDIYQY
jgi:hypothetical protein